MNFISSEFLVFFFIVYGLYVVTTRKVQNALLLVASYVFYGWWDWRFLSLIAISTVVDFYCGRLVDPHGDTPRSDRTRLFALRASIFTNLGILAFFKYFNFFAESLTDVAAAVGWSINPGTLEIILPVGISFYTFQTMSYTIDVYRGELRSTDRFLDFALYVSFFPQLVAGPIERAKHLLPQMLKKRVVNWDCFTTGLQLTLWGFFKKMVIADNLAPVVNSTFRLDDPSPSQVLIALWAFAFQIYGDFSGYTDIARGTARMMGFDLRLNFRRPYFATNPSDFWQRWHISLSSWLRDYLYIPLGGNRCGPTRVSFNLFMTMLLGGLWHGASWVFVIWGAYHGAILTIFHRFTNRKRAKAVTYEKRYTPFFWLKIVFFFQVTLYGWLIFRAESVTQLWHMTKCLFDPAAITELSWTAVSRVLWFIVPLGIFETYQHLTDQDEPWTRWPMPLRAVWYVVLFYLIVLFGSPYSNEFIYFQF